MLLFDATHTSHTGAHLPGILAMMRGPRVAVISDAIGLKQPRLIPPGNIAQWPAPPGQTKPKGRPPRGFSLSHGCKQWQLSLLENVK